jgi:hypothetical protein
MGEEQVSDKKINTFAKLLVHLDITRPCGDDVFNDPTKVNKLTYVSDKRLALLKQIDELDVSAQQKIGKRYRELAEEYNASLDEEDNMSICILHLSGNEFFNTQINTTTNVSNLFDEIFRHKHKFYTQYTLLFDGKELNVNSHKRTLTSYGIKHGSCLNIIIHDARKAEYITTTNDNGSVTTRLNIIDEDTDLSTLFPGIKIVAF